MLCAYATRLTVLLCWLVDRKCPHRYTSARTRASGHIHIHIHTHTITRRRDHYYCMLVSMAQKLPTNGVGSEKKKSSRTDTLPCRACPSHSTAMTVSQAHIARASCHCTQLLQLTLRQPLFIRGKGYHLYKD